MALALADKGIRVNAIGPGSINTEMVRAVNDDPVAWNRLMSRTPMGRLGEPEEMGNVAVFLASADASYITDRKSTRLNPVTNAHLVCRLLLEKKKHSITKYKHYSTI